MRLLSAFELGVYSACYAEPLFLSCAEKDVAFNAASRGRAIDILQSGGKDYHVQLFSGVEHGFALKGDITKRYQRRFPPISTTNQAFTKAVGFAKEQSHASIVSWLDFWLMQERFDVT